MIKSIQFALHITTHPIDGFWDMKYEKRGRLKTAIFIIFLTFMTFIFEKLVTGFTFHPQYNQSLNVFFELRKVLLPFILFCLANWSITTLMDGEGKAKDIVMAAGYALTPLILIRVPLAILTNFLTLKEATYVNMLMAIAVFWAGFLLFIGMMTIHQYTVTKTVFTMLFTAVSMGIIIFICMIFFSLITEIIGFLYTIYNEFVIRL